jgi:hypothetical protein
MIVETPRHSVEVGDRPCRRGNVSVSAVTAGIGDLLGT